MSNQQKTQLEAFLEMAAQRQFLILDTETTGLHDGEICSIAITHCNGHVLLDCLVKTVQPIPADATRIHGITDDMVVDSPDWRLLAPRVLEMISGQDVVIYNAVYDRKMMHRTAERHGMEKIDWKTHATFWCAMEAYAEFWGEWNDYHGNYRWQKLTDACRQQRIIVDNAHDALGDAYMTSQLVDAMLKARAK